jgi:hypothetical protein
VTVRCGAHAVKPNDEGKLKVHPVTGTDRVLGASTKKHVCQFDLFLQKIRCSPISMFANRGRSLPDNDRRRFGDSPSL